MCVNTQKEATKWISLTSNYINHSLLCMLLFTATATVTATATATAAYFDPFQKQVESMPPPARNGGKRTEIFFLPRGPLKGGLFISIFQKSVEQSMVQM